MLRSLISILLSSGCITGIIMLNYFLAENYRASSGKTRALYGIIEMGRLPTKAWLMVVALLALAAWIFAIRANEKRSLIGLAIFFNLLTITMIFIRLWTVMV